MAPAAKQPAQTSAEGTSSSRTTSASPRRPHPIVPPLPPPGAAEAPAVAAVEPKHRRRRGSRGGRRHKRREAQPEAVAPEPQPEPEPPAPAAEEEGKPKRRRGSRGGRRHRRGRETAATAEPVIPAAIAPPAAQEQAAPAPAGRRRRGKVPEAAAGQPEAARVPTAKPAREAEKPGRQRGERRRRAPTVEKPAAKAETPARAPRPVVPRSRARVPVTGAPTEEVPPPFAHPAEYEFARILDFYGIDWQYEPRSFPLRWERGHVSEAFTPDFYLPDLDLYVELTTLKTGLTAEKNRKMRLLKEQYPGTKIILLKKRDYLRLLAKYGYGPLSPDQVPVDRVLVTATRIQQRVGELGAQISRDYADKEPVLIGILRGVICFISDLMRHISLPTTVDFMVISSYDGDGAATVRILKDLEENVKGRDVILVEDIVDTGMTLNHVVEYLQTKRPASVRVCALLDKRARRIVDVPLDYVGFEIPDEFVVGYGLDFRQRFRNLPFIGILRHEQLP